MKEENQKTVETNTDIAFRVTGKICKLHRQIGLFKQELAREACRVKEALAVFFSSLETEEAHRVASDLYWSEEYFANLVRESFYQAFQTYPRLEKKLFKEPCPLCDDDRMFRCTSWSSYHHDTAYNKAGDLKKIGFWIKLHACAHCRQEAEINERESHRRYEERAREEAAEIKRLRSLPYREYLQTDHWQDVRYRALRRGHFQCYLCNAERVELHVHHRTYENLGRERYDDLIVLCRACHRRHHDLLPEREDQG